MLHASSVISKSMGAAARCCHLPDVLDLVLLLAQPALHVAAHLVERAVGGVQLGGGVAQGVARVGQLRREAVTLALQLHADRR